MPGRGQSVILSLNIFELVGTKSGLGVPMTFPGAGCRIHVNNVFFNGCSYRQRAMPRISLPYKVHFLLSSLSANPRPFFTVTM